MRVQFITDDGAIILLHYIGLVERTEAFKAAAEKGTKIGRTDQYMRMAMRFDTGIEKCACLNESLFVAERRLVAAQAIEYRIYNVL